MQLSQLQGIIQECKRIVSKNQKLDTEQHRLDRELAQVSKQIRLQRIDLTKLKYEVKRNVKLQKQSKEVERVNQSLRRQLKEGIAIRKKQFQSHQKISTIVANMQKQIDVVDSKINDAYNQIEKQAKQDELIVRRNQRQVIYLKLKKQLQAKSASNRKYNQDCSLNSREKLKNISPVNDLIGRIDLKYQQLCQKIEVQREIINKIYNTELNDRPKNTEFVKSKTEIDDQLEQNANYHFKKSEELNPIEKAEVTNILLREQFKKQQEDHIMGRILRQNIKNTYNVGRIINNRYRFNFNLSEISKIGETTPTNKPFQSEGKFDFSSQNPRLKKLQASKRIRTRQSQIRRYSQQYRNFLVNDSQGRNGIEPLPSHSILDVYNQLKKARSGKNRIGDIEVIKVMKYNQKRKRLASERGGGLQICDQY